MSRRGEYEFRFAETPQELEQVHRLNYQTFVREIPQHHDSGTGSLVDKFHDKNKYLMGLRRGELVGMLSVHDQPPFSVADRMPDPTVLAAPGLKLIEIRLLAVIPEERGHQVLAGLVWQLYQYARIHGYTHFIMSGVESQGVLYGHLGFEPLGPPVGDGPRFTPMWLPLAKLEAKLQRTIVLLQRRDDRHAARTAEDLTTDERSAPTDRATASGDHGD